MRFALRELLIVVSITALAAAAFARGESWLQSTFESLTFVLIMASVLLAIGRTGRARQFWLGMAIVAGSYCYFAKGPDDHGYSPRRYGSFFSSKLLVTLISKMHPDVEDVVEYHGVSIGTGGGGGLFSVVDVERVAAPQSADPTVHLLETELPGDGSDEQTIPGSQPIPLPASISLQFGTAQQIDPTWTVIDAQFHIGHCSLALLFGWIGGHFLAFVWQRSQTMDRR